jgi:DNA-binding NarL/FixJ family response regulator
MRKIEILLVNDHPLFTETLSSTVNSDSRFRVLAATDNADTAFTLAQEHTPDIVLLDINISPVDGFALTERLIRHSAEFKIIVIAAHTMVSYIKPMLMSGASGYLTKNTTLGELFTCVMEVFKGRKYICTEMINAFISNEWDILTSPAKALSGREIGIAKLLKEGLTSKDIASRLSIAPRTVEAHRHNILKKLKLKNTAALVNFSNRNGI